MPPQLADLYTTSIDGPAYANFLRKLFERVTVRVTTGSDGRRTTKKPAAPPAARLQEYRAFRKSIGEPEATVPAAEARRPKSSKGGGRKREHGSNDAARHRGGARQGDNEGTSR